MLMGLIPNCLLASLLLTNCTDVATAARDGRAGIPFSLVATAIRGNGDADGSELLLNDGEGGVATWKASTLPEFKEIRNGDLVRVDGETHQFGLTLIKVTAIQILERRQLPPAPLVTSDDLASGRYDCRETKVRGTVREVFRDEIDPRFVFVTLENGRQTVYSALCCDEKTESALFALRNAEVEVRGIVSYGLGQTRSMIERTLLIPSHDAITILRPAPSDAFDVPLLKTLSQRSPADIVRSGRCRTTGTVTAVWGDRNVLLHEGNGNYRNVRLARRTLPACNDRIEVVGRPETDLFRINLTDADWRPAAVTSNRIPTSPVQETTAEELLTDGRGHPELKPKLHGKRIRVTGTIVDQPVSGSIQKTVVLKSGAYTLPVDVTSAEGVLKRISVGCTVSVTAICIVETEAWHPHAGFPHATGTILAPQSEDDITVLTSPSWWTPERLILLVGALILALIGISVWNRVQQRIIDRKSDDLAAEKLASARSGMLLAERTNLAVEIHDSLSQTLTGAALEIETARRLADQPDAQGQHLATAERTLQSCREELRNCLWDLRNDTLDVKDMTSAVLKTLEPLVDKSRIAVRFNVPRELFTDKCAHDILCIVRELTVNAIRHGAASCVRIAGNCDEAGIRFSVTDDGCGFDPSACPGIRQGHFGLQGIRERIRKLDGRLTLESTPGHGCKATVHLPNPS